MSRSPAEVRRAQVADAATVARLLVAFNTEFDTPTPPAAVLTERLTHLLATDTTWALLAEVPEAVGVALITVRPNVWYPGPVALLDELYVAPPHRNGGIGSALIALLMEETRVGGVSSVEISVDDGDSDAQRFYRRHGFTDVDEVTGEGASYWYLELDAPR